MDKYITILEVSQKQAYIFSSNKLQDNIVNSAIIARVLSPEYLKEVLNNCGYSGANMVYSGGGHTVLEFDDLKKAEECVCAITENIYKKFNGLEVFAKTIKYDENKSAQVNLKELSKQLEQKKAIRRSAFHQGSYGIEKVDANNMEVCKADFDNSEIIKTKKLENDDARKFYPDGLLVASEFKNLGGSKGENNFVAVVHIDGNGMGKRVDGVHKLIENLSWSEIKEKLNEFSNSVDRDFKNAFAEMLAEVSKKQELWSSVLDNSKYMPVRRIITAGDDICFVSEGRLGIECARIFIEKLSNKKNDVDGKGYSACAGVAIVHQKYPFFKAYELAEKLCSNAKRYGATISKSDNGVCVSSIDWHIEYGEVKDTLNMTRRDYLTSDGANLCFRPYVVRVDDEKVKTSISDFKKYDHFKKLITAIQDKSINYATGKIKELRNALKRGENETRNYLEFNRMSDILVENNRTNNISIDKMFTGESVEKKVYVECDGKKYSILFDAIELMDTFLAL